MSTQTDALLNPVGDVMPSQLQLAPRLKTLQGGGRRLHRRQQRSTAIVFLARFQELLTQQYGWPASFMSRKPLANNTYPSHGDAEMEKCNFVVHAHAD